MKGNNLDVEFCENIFYFESQHFSFDLSEHFHIASSPDPGALSASLLSDKMLRLYTYTSCSIFTVNCYSEKLWFLLVENGTLGSRGGLLLLDWLLFLIHPFF